MGLENQRENILNIKLHRGGDSIGGTITEIYTDTTHIYIDFGMELNPEPEMCTDGKMIEMIQKAECDAVLFSHYHGDHIGLMSFVPKKDIREKDILMGLGDVSRKVLINIHKTLDSDFVKENERKEHQEMLALLRDDKRFITYETKKCFEIGDIKITPLRLDHSAYDAYMFVIESGDKCIVHTGDYRMHGRLGNKLFSQVEEYLKDKKVDILITEGTMMERQNEKVKTEEEMEREIYNTLNKPENKWAFLICSSTNVESLASFHNAALKLGRPFIVNHYVFEQIKLYRDTAGTEDRRFLFQKTYSFENMEKPSEKLGGLTQPEYMKENGFLMLVGKSDAYKKRMEYFRDLDPLLFYSMWEGYIDKDNHPDTYDEDYGRLVNEWRCDKNHTSGHAPAGDIKRMIDTVSPLEGVIPVHTTRQQDFEKLDLGEIKIIPLNDGEIYCL